MAAGFDVAVIGAGVIGAAVAWEAARAGAAVCVIDAGARVPPATNAAAGMLAPSFEAVGGADGAALYRLGAASLQAWADFAGALQEETGRDLDYRPHGILGVAYSAEDAAAMRAAHDRLRALGAKVALLDGDEASAREPGVARPVLALHAPDDAQIDPRRTLAALQVALRRRRVRMIDGRAVALAPAGAVMSATLEDGTRIEAERVVLAAGSAAKRLDPSAPLVTVKGEALALSAPAQAAGRQINACVRAPGAYLCPRADGRLIVGATEIPNDDSLDVDGDRVDALRRRAHAAAPGLASWREETRWAGLRPGTADGAPILGPDPIGAPAL
ncbi:MAG: FAD-dependent oxidoreductase, partial [Pseudomonadota bacterium]